MSAISSSKLVSIVIHHFSTCQQPNAFFALPFKVIVSSGQSEHIYYDIFVFLFFSFRPLFFFRLSVRYTTPAICVCGSRVNSMYFSSSNLVGLASITNFYTHTQHFYVSPLDTVFFFVVAFFSHILLLVHFWCSLFTHFLCAFLKPGFINCSACRLQI